MIFAQGLPHGNITEPRPFSDPFENEADYAAVTRFFVKETTVLSGKVALVMGSTSGIGLGIARALAADSADTMALKEGVGVRWSKPMPFAITDELMSGITIRAVRPDDKERLVTAFKALEPRSIYLRFFSLKKELSDQELRRVTECDGASEVALVATIGGDDRETIVAMGNYVRAGAAAEIAFAVEEDFQGRGIAARLLRQLEDIARTNGVSQLEADVLAENTPMLKVFRKSGLRMRESRSQGVVHATLLLT